MSRTASTRSTWGVGRKAGPTHIYDAPSVLRDAADRAAVLWRQRFADDIDAETAAVLPGAIIKAATNGDENGSVDRRLRSAPARRLLTLVRSEFLHLWHSQGESVPAGEMLTTLQSLESVAAAMEPDPAEAFADRLTGLDGVELLVEVAHDLRSPLTSILFLAEALQRRLSGDINDLQYRQLGLIYSAALGLSEMASNVLEFIRGGNRLTEDEPSPFSIDEVVQSVLDITKPVAEEKGLTVRFTPPPTDHKLGHPLALRRVLLNLTTNALKFTEDGSVEIVARETSADRIEFSVRDTGPGIDQAALGSLYSSVRPACGETGFEFSPAGLGLALCRRLVEAMGSELCVESEPGIGTRFSFEVQLRPYGESLAI